MNFGYIYGLGLFGSAMIYFLINMIKKDEPVDLYQIVSILGYCIGPLIFLSILNLTSDLKSIFGAILVAISIFWCTILAVRFVKTVG